MEKSEIIKIIVQYLNNKGYKEVGDKLGVEANVQESVDLKILKSYIKEGNYELAIQVILMHSEKKEQIYLIPKIRIAQIFNSILLNFDEDRGKNTINQNETLSLIRKICNSSNMYEKDITIQKCVGLVFIHRKSELIKKMKELCPVAFSKESLNEYIESTLSKSKSLLKSLHPKSLETMMDSLVKHQISNCLYHNDYLDTRKLGQTFSYFEDHQCKETNIPYKCVLTIEEHEEEIINIIPSTTEKLFAVVLKSNYISIYRLRSLSGNKIEIDPISNFKAHSNQITSLQWNKLDTMILTASKDKTVKIYDIYKGVCKTVFEQANMVSSAIFFEDESTILTSCLGQKISLWSREGSLIDTVTTVTINELHYSKKYNIIILIAPTIKAIILYDYSTKSEIDKLNINDTIVSTSLSKTDEGEFLLVNSSNATPVLTLWKLSTRKNVRKYFGHRQERLITKCSFGGELENFLLSGSDNKEIYIWNRNASIPVLVIKAHSSCVNSAIWPTLRPFSSFVISGSDDHTIKVFSNDKNFKISFVKNFLIGNDIIKSNEENGNGSNGSDSNEIYRSHSSSFLENC